MYSRHENRPLGGRQAGSPAHRPRCGLVLRRLDHTDQLVVHLRRQCYHRSVEVRVHPGHRAVGQLVLRHRLLRLGDDVVDAAAGPEDADPLIHALRVDGLRDHEGRHAVALFRIVPCLRRHVVLEDELDRRLDALDSLEGRDLGRDVDRDRDVVVRVAELVRRASGLAEREV